ncbi:MAG: TonB-dependent receptor [Pedobacter sp.]|nr:MAG: TonB-dependent receptor [Pedobacter sp.]
MKSFLHITCLWVVFMLTLFHTGFAQQKNIKGVVNDEKGLPVPGVSIMVKGTQQGTSTNGDGQYTITVPSSSAVLVFRAIGYATREVVAASSPLNVNIKETSGDLDEVVVKGFGAQQKKITVTGSVSTISGKDLVSTSVANVSNMLIGNAPGVSGLQQSGEPGRNGSAIYIRGVSTYAGSTDPLIVIDGVPEPPEQTYSRLNSMDANEIESLNILKDASSTAVYGVRGANGVIIVTTKRGKVGKPVLSASTNFGFTTAANLPRNVSSYDFAVMRNEAIRTEQSTYGVSAFNDLIFDANDLWKFANNRDYLPSEVAAYPGLNDAQKAALNASPALYYSSRDLFKDQFGGRGPQQQFNLNIAGGTEKVKYYTSLGYFSQGSILQNTDYFGANTNSTYNRYNFLSNFDINAVKNLAISVNLSGQFGTTVGPGIDGGTSLGDRYKIIMQYLYDTNAMMAPGIIDNKLINSIAGNPGTPSNPLGRKIGSLLGNQNSIRNLLASGSETTYDSRLSGRIGAKYTMDYLTKGLSLRANVNYENNYSKATTYRVTLPEYSVRRNPIDPNVLDFFGGERTSSGTFNPNPNHNSVNRTFYIDAGIDYARTLGNHSLTALVLGNAQKYYLPFDNFNTPSGNMGLVANVAYNYKEKYLAEVSVGYNGTEQFAEGQRFGLFPAYSAGWVMSNESFFPKNDYFTFFKIRASYGLSGYDKIGGDRYVYLPSTFVINQPGYYFGNGDGSVANTLTPGTNESKLGNPDVTWEEETKRNLAIEAKFFKNRLSLVFEAFKNDRTNIFTQPGTIPATYGVSAANVPRANLGIMNNKGYEVSLGWTESRGDFSYNINGYLSYAKNKIVFNAEAQNPYPWMNTAGYSFGQYRGFVSDGFYNTQEELNNRPNLSYNGNQAALGDIRYKDINGDGQIDASDRVPIGYTNRALYDFSLKTGMTYKGFDLNVLFIGKSKGSFNINNGMNHPFVKNAGNAFQWQFDGRWTPEKVANGEKITFPRATISGSASEANNYQNSDFWLVSNAFKKLKNVEIGYSFKNYEFLKKAHISSLRIYANGNNLLTWDNAFDEIDPEQTDSGTSYLFPLTRAFIFGANIRF